MTTNLNVVKSRLASYPELTQEDRDNVSHKIDQLLESIEKKPKTLAWKLRAKVGPKSKWYKDVEDVNR